MALTLSKGGNLSLTKEAPGLNMILIGLGWDPRATDGADFDLDASIFMLGADGKARSSDDFIFYNQMDSKCGSVHHTGDNRTGAGDGDDEQMKLNLSKVPADIDKIVIAVTIHDAEKLKLSFGQVGGAFVRLVNDETAVEVARFDLQEDYSTETAMVFAEIYRNGAEWKFRAVGAGYAGGLDAMCKTYNVNLG